MKVLHVPFCFAPDPVGGTEIYVAALASELIKRGVEAVIAAPGAENGTYEIDGLRVRRFETSQTVENVSELYDDGDPLAAEEFEKIMDDEKPDIVNLHAFTPAVSLRLVRVCKRRRVPVVFTYHTPTVSCQRGTMMLWGRTPCDGKLDLQRCTACTLQGLALPRALARAVSHFSADFGQRLDSWGLEGGLWTVMRMSQLTSLRQSAFREMGEEVDHLIAVCNWVRDVIVANGIAPKKVTVNRHGVDVPGARTGPGVDQPRGASGQATRFVFFGRYDPTKGLHVLIDAFRTLPSQSMSLDIFGVAQSAANRTYERRMKALAECDPRIRFHSSLAKDDVINRLRDYDFLLVPSQWMETGPLVILEAFAAGVPVIGQRIGGIAELVRDSVDGLLVDLEPGDAWPNALRRVVEDSRIKSLLKAGVRRPRTTTEVVDETLTLYRSMLVAQPRPLPNEAVVV